MSDHYVTLTVYLSEPTKDEYTDPIMKAIEMVKGVRAVELGETPVNWDKEKAKDELRQMLFEVLYPSYTPKM